MKQREKLSNCMAPEPRFQVKYIPGGLPLTSKLIVYGTAQWVHDVEMTFKIEGIKRSEHLLVFGIIIFIMRCTE